MLKLGKFWANQEQLVTLGPSLFKGKFWRRVRSAAGQWGLFLVPLPFDLQLTGHPEPNKSASAWYTTTPGRSTHVCIQKWVGRTSEDAVYPRESEDGPPPLAAIRKEVSGEHTTGHLWEIENVGRTSSPDGRIGKPLERDTANSGVRGKGGTGEAAPLPRTSTATCWDCAGGSVAAATTRGGGKSVWSLVSAGREAEHLCYSTTVWK